ncbi:MAG: hypothetical protein K940chlam7_01252 [Chlamydiae bacterium]|nr:hypothetical protein [Chlamydiota bacterium]
MPQGLLPFFPAGMTHINSIVAFEKRDEKVNPDEVFYISLAAQISDLSLQIFIPLNRLIFPQTDTIAPRGSFLKRDYRDPLKYFKKSQNLIRLESILRILEGGRLRLEGTRVLLTLSRYFEALSVYGGTLTANHWVFEEDSLSLTIWSMLSYYCHCLDEFSEECPHIIHLINKKLIEAFEKDVTIFREIFEYETLKEQHDHLTLKRIELQMQKFYELTWEQPTFAKGRRNIHMPRMIASLNFPERRELSAIERRKVFSPQEKYKRAEKVWDTLSSSHPARDRVMEAEEIIRISQTIDTVEKEMNKRKSIIELRTQRAALNEVKRTLQGLFEYEQLGIGLQCTQQLLQSDTADPAALTQWLIVLRESLKMMVTDKTLNISLIHSLSTLSNLIKTIRDYFEHPEDYVLKLNHSSKANKSNQRLSLEAGLFNELKRMGRKVISLMEVRQKKMHQILRPHPNIDPQDVLTAFASRNAQQDEGLSNARKLACEEYPAVIEFAERVIDKRNHEKVDKQFLFIPFPRDLPPRELLDRLQEGCKALRSLTSSLRRSQLEKKILEEMPFRLMIQRQISVAARLLEQFMKLLKKDHIEDSPYETLENVYFEARDARNFQTHDLWREDIQGVVNAVYLLGYDCPEVLSSLLKPAPFSQNSLEARVIQKVVHGRLTQKKLNQAIARSFNLNAYDDKNRSLLHFLACNPSNTNLRLAQFVIKKGGNIHQADYAQLRPLHYAAESGFMEMAQLLVEQGAVVDAHSCSGTPTEVAQYHEYTALAQFLSNQRGMSRSSNAKALLDAVNSLDVEKIRNLIARDYDPLADFDGSLPLVALFDKAFVPFHLQIDIARILFQAGADINQQEPSSGQSVLHAATTYTDEVEVITFLMSFHPNINLQDGQKNTPLHNAVACKNKRWVRTLLQAGASVNEKEDSLGNTPLLNACNMNQPSSEIIEALLKYGANAEAENEFGSVLHHVVDRGTADAVSVVLKHGASPFAVGRGGLYYHKMPSALSESRQVTRRLFEKMKFLFSHLSEEDQEKLITITGRDSGPFQAWKQYTLPTSEQEWQFLGRLYQRRFGWIS